METIHKLDKETIELFAAKGTKNNKPRPENPNGYKVRRVMQVIKDLSKKPFSTLKVLDLACGEGVYSVEAALRGAYVNAIDARYERMSGGIAAAEKLGILSTHTYSGISFIQQDIRNLPAGPTGWPGYDVVLCLGILYHLGWEDILTVIKRTYDICARLLVIDTHIALNSSISVVEHAGKKYYGYRYREHQDNDSEDTRRKKQLASIDNTWSFWLTYKSLICLLRDTGYTSIYKVEAPLEPFKPQDRVTLVAVKEEPVLISTYPWVNGK